jgi:hypothetical protein
MTILLPEDPSLSNPPLVHWQGTPKATRYRVAIAGRNHDSCNETGTNYFTPERELPAGIYGVEITALGADGKPVAPAASREFRIRDTGDRAPGNLNSIACPPGTPLIATPAQLERLGNAVGEQGLYRDLLVEAARKPDPLLAGEIREPARYPGFKWDFQHWHEGNQLCFAVENTILASTLAFLVTDETAFADEAVRLMLIAADWDPEGSTGTWENDHSAQALLHALALGYNALHGRLAPDARKRIAASITARCADIHGQLNPYVPKDLSCGPMNNPENNHPWFVAASMGIGGLALMGEDPRAGEWASYAAQLFHGNFLCRGGRSGGWHEGIDYWSYSLFFVFHFADALRNATGIDLYRHWWLERTVAFKAYCHPPAGSWVPFGDCKHRPANGFDKLIAMRLASALEDSASWAYVDAIGKPVETARLLFHAVLWSDRGAVPAPASAPAAPFARHFEDVGWVVSLSDPVRDEEQVLFALHCGPGSPHGHADQNSFVLCAGGDRLLWDAGYYDSYYSPHHRGYSRLSAAHNTLLVEGEGQTPHGPSQNGRITRFDLDGANLTVVADASDAPLYAGRVARFIRTFEYRGKRTLTVSDDIHTRDPFHLSLMLHSVFPIVYDSGTRMITIRGTRFGLRAVVESDVPVEAVVTSAFPVNPGLVSQVLDDAAEYPDQYHLEIRTVTRVDIWRPVLKVEIRELNSE